MTRAVALSLLPNSRAVLTSVLATPAGGIGWSSAALIRLMSHQLVHAVGAQQQPRIGDAGPSAADPLLGRRAHTGRDQVLHPRRGRLVVAAEVLGHRVVVGDLFQDPAVPVVGPAVADPGHVAPGARRPDPRHRDHQHAVTAVVIGPNDFLSGQDAGNRPLNGGDPRRPSRRRSSPSAPRPGRRRPRPRPRRRSRRSPGRCARRSRRR